MAYVGTATAGKVLTATGNSAGSTFLPVGSLSGLNANGVVISQNNSAFTATTAGNFGDVLTSNGPGFDPSFQIASTGIFPWNNLTVSKTASVNNGYTTDGVGLVVVTLPSSAAYGSIIRVVGIGAAGWQVAQNPGQVIHFGNVSTTTGPAGYIQSTGQYDAIELLCTVADTDFTIINGPQGNITYN